LRKNSTRDAGNACKHILSYSPHDNVAARDYPAIIAMAGLTDPPGHLPGTGEVGRAAQGHADRRPGRAAHQHGRRPRRRRRPLGNTTWG